MEARSSEHRTGRSEQPAAAAAPALDDTFQITCPTPVPGLNRGLAPGTYRRRVPDGPSGGPLTDRDADRAGPATNRVGDNVLARMRQRDAPGRTDEPTRRAGPGRAGADPIRRLVGFEVELSVPTLQPANLHLRKIGRDYPQPSRRIDSLFAGGLPWNHHIGGTAAGITLHADHNKLASSGEDLYDAIEDCSPGATAPNGYVDISNLEYKTPALDELAAGSTNRFLAQANAIDAHADSVLRRGPRNRLFRIPGALGYSTGIPLDELEQWLPYLHPAARRTDRHITRARTALRNLRDDVEWDMYVQATVGVLPSGLRQLYWSQAVGLPAGHGGDINAASQDAAAAIRHAEVNLPAQPFVATFVADVGGITPLSLEALYGTLTMAVSYAIGNAYGMTNIDRTTPKNAVQLMSKLRDSVAVRRATTDELYALRDHAALPAFITAAAAWIHTYPQTGLAHWQAPPYNAVVTRERLFGRTAGSQQQATEVMLTDMFTTSTNADVRISRNMEPDPAPPALAVEGVDSGGQRGIPMEMRWIPTRPSGIGQLWPVFQQVLAETRLANLSHAPAGARDRIMAAL